MEGNQLGQSQVGATACRPNVITQEQVHEFRKEIDANILKAQGLANGYFGEAGSLKGKRENALVITKLQEAKMWAGKILEAMNAPFPEELRDSAK
jgi:hypothetical protein